MSDLMERATEWAGRLLAETANAPDLPAARRAGLERMRERSATAGPLPVDVVPGDVGGVPVEWLLPESVRDGGTGAPVLIYAHGGGWILGCPEEVREAVARMAVASGIRAVSVQYRLAPEHGHPAASDDVVAVYDALRAEGVAAGDIVLAGESAGGTLALAALLEIRDRGGEVPAAGVLLSPLVDFEAKGESWIANDARDPINAKAGLERFVPAYLGDHSPFDASPTNADLAGLPPLLIQVGTAEVLIDDCAVFAGKAEAAGVEVQYEEWEEMIHLWHGFPYLPQAHEATDRIGAFVAAHLG